MKTSTYIVHKYFKNIIHYIKANRDLIILINIVYIRKVIKTAMY